MTQRPTPHPHGCPECACTWDCHNDACTDHIGQWCKNFCHACTHPPQYLREIQALETAGHLINQAAAILVLGAKEEGLADQVNLFREAILSRVQERGRGVLLAALGTRSEGPS